MRLPSPNQVEFCLAAPVFPVSGLGPRKDRLHPIQQGLVAEPHLVRPAQREARHRRTNIGRRGQITRLTARAAELEQSPPAPPKKTPENSSVPPSSTPKPNLPKGRRRRKRKGRPGRGRRLPSGPGQSGREVADRLPRVPGRPVRGRAEATHGLRAHRAAAGAAARDPGAAARVPLSKMRRDSRGSAAAGRGARLAVRRVDHYAALHLPYTQAISLQRLRGCSGRSSGCSSAKAPWSTCSSEPARARRSRPRRCWSVCAPVAWRARTRPRRG